MKIYTIATIRWQVGGTYEQDATDRARPVRPRFGFDVELGGYAYPELEKAQAEFARLTAIEDAGNGVLGYKIVEVELLGA